MKKKGKRGIGSAIALLTGLVFLFPRLLPAADYPHQTHQPDRSLRRRRGVGYGG